MNLMCKNSVCSSAVFVLFRMNSGPCLKIYMDLYEFRALSLYSGDNTGIRHQAVSSIQK